MTNYTQDYINTLDDFEKLDLFDKLYSLDSDNEILDWGVSVEDHPTIDEEDDEILEDFKFLYINKGLVQGIGVKN